MKSFKQYMCITARILGLFPVLAEASFGYSENSPHVHLPDGLKVHLPGSPKYIEATRRWSAAIKPDFEEIIEVTSEEDVQAAVNYANLKGAPFLPISGGHGTSMSLSSLSSGIGIWLRSMSDTHISGNNSKGPIATIQGGSLSGEVIKAVTEQGKILVSGACSCTGFVAPLLGGGHGWLQGRYGLIADNLISARIVLGNSSIITVSSVEHSDLLWALRGAGHNFGIVTSIEYQVYDRNTEADDGFTVISYVFTQDKLEAIFAIANEWIHERERPVELGYFAAILNAPAIDTRPIISFFIIWQGTSEPSVYARKLDDLVPVSKSSTYADLLEVNQIIGASYDGPSCAEGFGRQLFPTELYEWNLKNLRSTLGIFEELSSAGLQDTVMLLEGFAVNKVQEIDPDSTAFPSRDHNLLASPVLTYNGNNSTAEHLAESYGKNIRDIMLRDTGLQLSAYVNYAHGDESQQAVYGYQPWRLERLKKLKNKYDPDNRFRYFAPLEV